jgi:hypothetical protein
LNHSGVRLILQLLPVAATFSQSHSTTWSVAVESSGARGTPSHRPPHGFQAQMGRSPCKRFPRRSRFSRQGRRCL